MIQEDVESLLAGPGRQPVERPGGHHRGASEMDHPGTCPVAGGVIGRGRRQHRRAALGVLAGSASQHAAVQSGHPLALPRPEIVLRSRDGPAAKPLPLVRVPGDRRQRVREMVDRVAGGGHGNLDPALFRNDVVPALMIQANHGQPIAEGFDHDTARGVAQAGEDEDIRPRIRLQGIRVREPSHPGDVRIHATTSRQPLPAVLRRPIAHDANFVKHVGRQPGERLDQQAQRLARVEVAGPENPQRPRSLTASGGGGHLGNAHVAEQLGRDSVSAAEILFYAGIGGNHHGRDGQPGECADSVATGDGS